MASGLTAGSLSLTVETTTQLLTRVPVDKWEWGGFMLSGFATKLGIPYDQIESIALDYPQEDDRVSAAVKWLFENQQISWRKIVCALDAVWESELADEVRDYLEPPKDPTLTTSNVMYVMGANRINIKRVFRRLDVPKKVIDAHGKGIHVGMYWRNTVPSASWESMAGALYSLSGSILFEPLVERVKEFLHIKKDPTLTVQNLEKVMQGLNSHRIKAALDEPFQGPRDSLERYHNTEHQLIVKHLRIYLSSHPCPSWSHIMAQLQRMGHTDAAKAASHYITVQLAGQASTTPSPMELQAIASCGQKSNSTTSTSEPQGTIGASLDSRPELRQLYKLSRGGKTVRIREETASQWKELAIQLSFQRGTIKTIQRNSDGCEDAFDELMSRWLDGGGLQPVTWKTLLQALKDIDLNVLAKDTQQILDIPPPPTSHPHPTPTPHHPPTPPHTPTPPSTPVNMASCCTCI